MSKLSDISPSEFSVPRSHKEEIKKRLERYKAGKTKFHSWKEIKKDLHSNH